ncbi:MAG TPA: VOC family protein, partial [Thermoanaerobaculia bacterium]|nr:VOC family protein [Thermoanaerobaculia bacterium]
EKGGRGGAEETMTVKAIPDNYHTITPYLTVEDLPRSVEFMKTVFDGVPTESVPDAEGVVRHAEVRIGDSTIMIGQARGDWKPNPGALYVYVEDTDATYQRALAAGATSIMPPAKQFYGDVNAGVRDPSGTTWWIATHVEDVSPEELERRGKESMK